MAAVTGWTGGADGAPAGAGSATTLDTYANAPASPASGDLHICSDCEFVRRYDGSAWADVLPGFGQVVTPPSTGWTKHAGSDASGALTLARGALRVTVTANRAYYYRAEPAATYEIVTVIRGRSTWLAGSPVIVLGGFYDSVTDDAMFMYFRAENNGETSIIVQRDSAWGATFASTAADRSFAFAGSELVAKIKRDATTLYFYVGNGHEWTLVHSEAVGAFLTPNAVVAGISTLNGGNADLLSWEVI